MRTIKQFFVWLFSPKPKLMLKGNPFSNYVLVAASLKYGVKIDFVTRSMYEKCRYEIDIRHCEIGNWQPLHDEYDNALIASKDPRAVMAKKMNDLALRLMKKKESE